MGLLDTTDDAAALQTTIQRKLGGRGRLALAFEITDLVWACARAGTDHRHSKSGTPAGGGSRDKGRLAIGTTVSIAELLSRIGKVLQATEIPHMLTGSFASSFHGTPRATQDIDIVIAPTPDQLDALLRALPETEYYVSRDAALAALSQSSQFNVIDLATGWQVDFILVKPRAFSRAEFERRRPASLAGVAVDVASAEDVLIAKLEWAKLGSSARQIEDAAGIIRMQGANLDTRYVERWVAALGLGQQWREAKAASS